FEGRLVLIQHTATKREAVVFQDAGKDLKLHEGWEKKSDNLRDVAKASTGLLKDVKLKGQLHTVKTIEEVINKAEKGSLKRGPRTDAGARAEIRTALFEGATVTMSKP